MERLASSLSLSVTSGTEERFVRLGSVEGRAARVYQKVTDKVIYCSLASRDRFFRKDWKLCKDTQYQQPPTTGSKSSTGLSQIRSAATGPPVNRNRIPLGLLAK